MSIRFVSAAALAGAGLLSACVTVVPQRPPPVVVIPDTGPPGDACNSAAFQQFVGQLSPTITLPPGAQMRHFRTGDPLTMDFNPERINFEYNRTGVLIRVSCG